MLLMKQNSDILCSVDFLVSLLLDSVGDLRPSVNLFVSLENVIHISLSSCGSFDHSYVGSIVLFCGVGNFLWLT